MGNRGYGRLWYVGYGGYSWASMFTGSNVHHLSFYCGGISPQDGNYRAFGFPLRCLQEEGRMKKQQRKPRQNARWALQEGEENERMKNR